MKAVVYTRYGSPDVLRFTDVEKPTPKDNEVLVKVQAVSLNRSDWEALEGKPLYARIMGPFRPRHHILGSDIAGRVEAAPRRNSNQATTCSPTSMAVSSRWPDALAAVRRPGVWGC
jgi:NADPH:quinone reductase-like Zn-dependent oxidoreductase